MRLWDDSPRYFSAGARLLFLLKAVPQVSAAQRRHLALLPLLGCQPLPTVPLHVMRFTVATLYLQCLDSCCARICHYDRQHPGWCRSGNAGYVAVSAAEVCGGCWRGHLVLVSVSGAKGL